MLENRLDKAMIKYNEAQSIRKTYEQIVARLKARERQMVFFVYFLIITSTSLWEFIKSGAGALRSCPRGHVRQGRRYSNGRGLEIMHISTSVGQGRVENIDGDVRGLPSGRRLKEVRWTKTPIHGTWV